MEWHKILIQGSIFLSLRLIIRRYRNYALMHTSEILLFIFPNIDNAQHIYTIKGIQRNGVFGGVRSGE